MSQQIALVARRTSDQNTLATRDVETTCSPVLPPQHCEHSTSVALYSGYYHTENSCFAYFLPYQSLLSGWE